MGHGWDSESGRGKDGGVGLDRGKDGGSGSG